MLEFLREKGREVVQAMAPLIAVVCLLQFTLVQAPTPAFLQFLAGAVLAAAGMLLLFAGIEVGVLPMGRYIGAELPRMGLWAIVVVAFAIGFATTAAEPDVLILAGQVQQVSGGRLAAAPLAYLIAAGVGLLAGVGLARIVGGVSLRLCLLVAYLAVLLLSLVAPAGFVPLAYDAGSVTTGVLSAPVLLALAVGLSSVLASRSAATDGFGLLGLASIGPILAVLVLGALLR